MIYIPYNIHTIQYTVYFTNLDDQQAAPTFASCNSPEKA